MTFEARLAENTAHVDARLDRLLSYPEADGTPTRLLDAMRHAVLGGGKRLRPHLAIECAATFGATRAESVHCACAFELIHCYSLVHDDLPAMDDDDVRRGRPSLHKAFDEWTAVLAGDALQTLAFRLVASGAADPERGLDLVRVLADAAGPAGMAGGQCLDLEAEKLGARQGAEDIARLQAMKTGALIAGACEAGAVVGGADGAQRRAMTAFGAEIGRLFQIVDDILDVTGDESHVGKATAKDAAKGKATLVSLLGLDACQELVAEAEERAIAALAPFGARAAPLSEAARAIAARDR